MKEYKVTFYYENGSKRDMIQTKLELLYLFQTFYECKDENVTNIQIEFMGGHNAKN